MDFLVDAQLPPLLCEWIEDYSQFNARHVSELKKGITSKDKEIWESTLQTGEIIVTKDFDFYDRALVANSSPKILHINIGNCSNNELIAYLHRNWETITNLFRNGHTLVSCNRQEIEYW